MDGKNRQKVTMRSKREAAGFSRPLHIIFCFVVPAVLVTALIITVLWGCSQRKKADALRLNGEGIYRQTYQELTESVLDLHNSLSKLLVSEAPHTLAATLDDIWRESGAIGALMGRIPQSHPDNYELNRFITQTGDYARQLAASVLAGKPISDSDRKQLLALYHASEGVYEDLIDRMNSGNFPTEAITEEQFFAQNTEKPGDEPPYPLIDYNGPFSDSTENRLPKVNGEPIDEQTALRRAAGILGTAALQNSGRVSGRLPAYSFSGTLPDGRSVDISISENGGDLVYFMTSPSGAEEGVISDEPLEALKKAGKEWLGRMGAGQTEPVYIRYASGACMISYVPVLRYAQRGGGESADGILVYGDLIRLWLDRNTGEVIGADTENWLYSHFVRELPEEILSADEAAEGLSPFLEVTGTRLALIPLPDGTEKLCWEFRGGFSGADFLVYMDAETGDEVTIFRFISDENGTAAV